MKIKFQLGVLVLLAALNAHRSTCFAQGSLTPPGAPAATMKTLAQVEPRYPISTAPFSITAPGSYYLTTNLSAGAGLTAITISVNNVVLDLAGFTLVGPATSSTGILISGAVTNVSVSNGNLTGWGTGVIVPSSLARNLVLDRLNIASSTGNGINAQNAIVSGCTVSGSGIYGLLVGSSEVRGCVISGSVNFGIFANYSTVTDCLVEDGNNNGIYVSSGTVSRCRVKNNSRSGIFVDFPGCLVADNVVTGNNIADLAGYAGIFVNDSNNRVENNFLNGNGSLGSGIFVNGSYSGNLILKNSVAGNGVNNYNISGSQVVGPLISTAGTITNSNPWANFSF